jgi:hypothetical protein
VPLDNLSQIQLLDQEPQSDQNIIIKDMMIDRNIGAEFSIASAIDAQHKRKRDFLRQASQTSVEDEVRCHKRTTSKNNAIFRTVASDASHDEEEREDPAEEEDELMLVNAYRSRHVDEVNTHQEGTSTEPLDLPLSPKHDECDFMNFSPISSFFHPAILRATTICESASDIFCGDPPEVDSRPCSPQECETVPENGKSTEALEEKKEREPPSWLTGTPTFNWSIPNTNSAQSLWTGVFQLGSS